MLRKTAEALAAFDKNSQEARYLRSFVIVLTRSFWPWKRSSLGKAKEVSIFFNSSAEGRLSSKHNKLRISPSLLPFVIASLFDASRRLKAYLISFAVERRLAILDSDESCNAVQFRFSTMSCKRRGIAVRPLFLHDLACMDRNLASNRFRFIFTITVNNESTLFV